MKSISCSIRPRPHSPTLLGWRAPDRILRSTMVVVRLETPTEPPKWAVLEREMIQALSDAWEEFFC